MNFRQFVPMAFGLLLLMAGGFVHGKWTGRWQVRDLTHVAARVHQIPEQIGDWICIEEGSISQAELQMAELHSYTMRHYRNQRTGATVTMLLMCGPTGPVAVHPPTACYEGRGYRQTGDVSLHRVAFRQHSSAPNSETLTSGSHQLMTAQFVKPGRANQKKARIFWSWSSDGNWSTPASPRVEFAGREFLFKLYVTQEAHELQTPDGTTPPEVFLNDLLPELRRTVFQSQTSDSLGGMTR